MRAKTLYRRAFTLIELVVVMALLSVMIGLVLPAAQRIRVAAASTQIANSLKQITLACHAANDVHGKLPPATGCYGDGLHMSLSVHLLPYVEQSSIFSLARTGTAPTDVAVPAFNAPLDSSTLDGVRVQNFAANVRIFDDTACNTPYDSTVTQFALACNQDLGSSFTDGTSNTIMFATRYANSAVVSANGVVNCSAYDGQLINDPGNYLTISGSFPKGTLGPVNFVNFRHVVWCTGTLESLGGLGHNPTAMEWAACGCKLSGQGYGDGSSEALATTYSPVGATYCFADISPGGLGSPPSRSGPRQILVAAPEPYGPGGGYRVGPTGNAFTGKYNALVIFSKVDRPLTSPPGEGPGAFFGALPMAGGPGAAQSTGWQLAPALSQVDCSMAGVAHSFTTSGLQVSLADGSVRVVSPAVSDTVWNFAMQPNDGNPFVLE